jgi:cbb3-type cytochrome oxidase subunit 3
MKLSDVMSHMQLSVFAEVALVIFMTIFVGVCVYMLRRGEHFQQAAELPLRSEGQAHDRSEP